MSQEEKIRWNTRYGRDEHVDTQPDRLVASLHDGAYPLPQRRVALDVACGAGRNAIWLAENGWDVYGCDISLEGLRIARRLANEKSVKLKLFCADLDGFPPPENYFDLIVVTIFLQRKMFPAISAALRPGGLLMFRTYVDLEARQGSGAPGNPDHRLRSRELLDAFAGLRTLHYQ